MPIDFPNTPSSGQEHTVGSTTWVYDGSKWNIKTVNAVSNDSMPVGAIMWFGGSSTPTAWLLCNGSAVSRSTYANLFAVVGTTYGSGDGSTTFNLPNISSTTGAYYIRFTTSVGVVSTTALATAPVGTMFDWPTTSSYPTGFLRADGSAVSRTTYADLFALCGTTYGVGDNSTTFNLPNLPAAGAGSPVKIIKATSSGVVEPSTVAHAASHVRGGSDVLDGDRTQIDFVPSGYTRNTTSAGGGAVTDLTAHLGGIDNQLIVLASGRNRIVNGGMLVNQRYGVNTQTARTGSRFPIADRFFGYANGGGSINTVTTGTVTPPPHGGNYYLQATVNATDSSLAASDYYGIHHEAEGFYLNGLGFGYNAPPSVTLSFYVFSSVTGTFSLTMSNGVPVGDRYYTTSYTINAANTWERKAITFVSPTTGVWDTTSLVLSIHWPLAAGSSYINPSLTNWQSTPGPYMITAAQTNFMANAGAVFRLTGVQLEIGSDPTPFENTRYAEELLRCQRYYQVTDYFQGTAGTSSTIVVVAPALVPMRGIIVPSIAGTTWAVSDNYAADANASSPTMPNIYDCSSRGARVALGGFTGLTTGRYYNSRPSTTSLIGLSAEALS